MNSAQPRRGLICVCLLAATIQSTLAATVILQPVADTTLIEAAPNNNMGGTQFINAGTTASNTRNRALIKFDFSSIPTAAKIRAAALTLEVTTLPNGGADPSPIALHRMLRAWGEGNKDSTLEVSPGLGFPATTNEATWNSPFAFTTNTWSGPGASNNFSATISSSTFAYGLADFPRFASTTQMVANVQLWLTNSSLNFGWMLKTETESVARTARRFGSREFAGIDTNSPPYLEIEFVPPPKINAAQIVSGQIRFSFLAETNQTYVVQFKNTLAATNAWMTLTNISTQTNAANIFVSDLLSTNTRFYRVTAP